MIKRKTALFVAMSLIFTCALSNVCYASTQSVTTSSSVSTSSNEEMNNDLSKSELY